MYLKVTTIGGEVFTTTDKDGTLITKKESIEQLQVKMVLNSSGVFCGCTIDIIGGATLFYTLKALSTQLGMDAVEELTSRLTALERGGSDHVGLADLCAICILFISPHVDRFFFYSNLISVLTGLFFFVDAVLPALTSFRYDGPNFDGDQPSTLL